VGIAGVALALVSGYAWSTRPESYRAAVIELLDQGQVAYTGLEVREICLPDPHCMVGDGTRTYATVVVCGGTASYGQITCYDRRGACYLDIAALDIRRRPLRDLRGVRFLPRQVVREIARIVGWLRAAIEGDQSSFVSELSIG
jgi:hypothetical protein